MPTTADPTAPLPGSDAAQWTTARTREALLVHYPSRRDPHQVDTATAAADLGVSTRSIQRWTNLADTRPIRPATLHRRIGTLLPDEQILRDEHLKLDQFREGLIWLKRERSRIPPMWHNRGWLQPHRLYLIRRHDSDLLGLVLSKGAESTHSEIANNATVIATLETPTRIHGEVLALEALADRTPWRVLPPNNKIRTTRFWLNSAPELTLNPRS